MSQGKVKDNKGVRGMGAEGYRKLIVWQLASEIRRRIYQITKDFLKEEMRRVSQMRDAGRSLKQNIQEGYQKNSLGEYIHSLEISKGSLGELLGDIEDCFEDKLILQEVFDTLNSLCKREDYLLARLLQSLYRKRKEGTWKKKFQD